MKGEVLYSKSREIVVFPAHPTLTYQQIQNGFHTLYKSKKWGYDIPGERIISPPEKDGLQDMGEMVSYSVNIYTSLQYQCFEGWLSNQRISTRLGPLAETDSDLLGMEECLLGGSSQSCSVP